MSNERDCWIEKNDPELNSVWDVSPGTNFVPQGDKCVFFAESWKGVEIIYNRVSDNFIRLNAKNSLWKIRG